MDDKESETVMDNIEREITELKNKVNILEREITNVKISSAKNEEKTNQLFSLLTKIESSIEKIANKIDILEGKPGQNWETVVRTGITIVVSALMTLFISGHL
ncbi:MAG TPA: hypothetical protein VIM42_04200 [Clostridium sp.]